MPHKDISSSFYCNNFYFPSLLDLAMKNVLLVALGGAIGAVLRWSSESISPTSNISSATLSINLIGSFGLGALMAGFSMGHASKETVHLLGIGLLGSFTTMSAYALQTVEIGNSSGFPSMAMYVALTSVGCPLMALGGWKLMSILT
jgi:CrcB protein